VWADDEFAQRMLGIVAPNLLVANTTVRPIIVMRINLRIKYIGYFRTNPGTMGKFGLTATSILSVFTKFTV
jgi:arginine decarboxylase-like protein